MLKIKENPMKPKNPLLVAPILAYAALAAREKCREKTDFLAAQVL